MIKISKILAKKTGIVNKYRCLLYSDLINISDIAPLSRGEGIAFGVV